MRSANRVVLGGILAAVVVGFGVASAQAGTFIYISDGIESTSYSYVSGPSYWSYSSVSYEPSYSSYREVSYRSSSMPTVDFDDDDDDDGVCTTSRSVRSVYWSTPTYTYYSSRSYSCSPMTIDWED